MPEIAEIERELASLLVNMGPWIISLQDSPFQIITKPDGSIATDADTKVEDALSEQLFRMIPHAYILGEERADMPAEECRKIFGHDYIWAVDPIDGTTNFVNRISNFATSVGLLKRNSEGHSPVAGAVLLPASREVLYSENGTSYARRLGSNERTELGKFSPGHGKNVIMLTDSFYSHYRPTYDGSLEKRQIGSNVMNIAYTASGRSIGTMTHAHVWDVAAGLAIGRNSGTDMRSYDDGMPKQSFSAEDFILGDPKNNWRLKEFYIISNAENYRLIKSIMIPK